LITNCSNNFGPYQFPEKFIPLVILKCLRAEPIPVYGDGGNLRDWLYVDDHCEALHTVLQKGRVGETYNIGGNNEQKNIDLVRLLCSILDDLCPMDAAKFESQAASASQSQTGKSNSEGEEPAGYERLITFVADRPGHDRRIAIDAGKIRRELGWAPKENFESALLKTVQWYLANQDWWQAILSSRYQLERLGHL